MPRNDARHLSIALVDDDRDFLEDTTLYLRSLGYAARGCYRPGLAFRFVYHLRPDALILDLDMPGTSGLHVLRRLRACSRTSRLPVVLLTAHDRHENLVSGFEHGLDDFLGKPYRPAELRLRLEAVIRRYHESARLRSFSGLADGAQAAADLDARLGDFTHAEFTLYCLRLPAWARLAHSDAPEAAAYFGRAWHDLAHALCDTLRRVDDTVIAGEHTPEVVLYCGVRSAIRDPAVVERLRRRVRAANRWLGRSWSPRFFLAPGPGGALVRHAAPRFSLLEVRLPAGRVKDTRGLFALLGVELTGPFVGADTEFARLDL